MLRLRIVQANFGDSFILEYGTDANPRHLLIDGGPSDVYDNDLREEIEFVTNNGGVLDLVAISHVDKDHIVGVMDLFAELLQQRANNEAELVQVGGLWHNSFADTIDTGGTIQARFENAMASAGANAMMDAGMAVNGISEGRRLRIQAQQLGVDINDGFPGGLVSVDSAPSPITFDNLTLTIVGPTQSNIDDLRQKWIDWLDDNGPAIASGDPLLMANADRSVPNLSSIMFVAEAHGRTILFTGDGRSDHLLDGLEAAGLLDANGEMHVDVLKVPHHGSNRNATRTFFRKITADTYVISANGHPDNPDLSTLIWIVEAAEEQSRNIDIIATNDTPSLQKLTEEYPQNQFTYNLEIMPSNHSFRRLTLA